MQALPGSARVLYAGTAWIGACGRAGVGSTRIDSDRFRLTLTDSDRLRLAMTRTDSTGRSAAAESYYPSPNPSESQSVQLAAAAAAAAATAGDRTWPGPSNRSGKRTHGTSNVWSLANRCKETIRLLTSHPPVWVCNDSIRNAGQDSVRCTLSQCTIASRHDRIMQTMRDTLQSSITRQTARL
jgi:hypothetical protein